MRAAKQGEVPIAAAAAARAATGNPNVIPIARKTTLCKELYGHLIANLEVWDDYTLEILDGVGGMTASQAIGAGKRVADGAASASRRKAHKRVNFEKNLVSDKAKRDY